MEYVRYKLDKFWTEPNAYDVIKNGVYMFPQFIPDCFNEHFILDNDKFWVLSDDKKDWVEEFEFISEEEYLKESKMEKKTLDCLVELLESDTRDNILIALEIYKTCKPNEHRYNKEEINSNDYSN